MLHNSYFLRKVFCQELDVMTPPALIGILQLLYQSNAEKCFETYWAGVSFWLDAHKLGRQFAVAMGSREYGSQTHRFGLVASPSNHQKIDVAPHGKLIPFLHCGRRFPNNGDPPVGLADSQDVHLFKGRGRGGGPSGVALTVFPNNLRHSEKVFGQLQYQTTINLRKHLQI